MFPAFRPTLYVQISPRLVSVRDARSGENVSALPEIALTRDGKPRVLEVGTRARRHESPTVQVINPFAHPRTLLADFTAGEQLLRVLVGRLPRRGSPFARAPRVVLHLQVDPAGGFTQVEIRAFRELALGAGAAEAILWQGPNLSDEQVLARQFPKEGQVLA